MVINRVIVETGTKQVPNGYKKGYRRNRYKTGTKWL